MNRLKTFSASFVLAYGMIQSTGLVMGTIWLTCGDGFRIGHIVSEAPLYLFFGFIITFLFTVGYAVILAAIHHSIIRCRESLMISSLVSVLLTALVFFPVGVFLYSTGSKMDRENGGLFLCSIFAGLLGNLAIRWYYRREQQRSELRRQLEEGLES